MPNESMSFTKAAMKYFGLKPDQKLGEFMTEVRSLTAEDKAEMAPQLGVALDCVVTL